MNLASRIESISKLYGSSIIVSEETFKLAQNVIEARELDIITVAGKTEPIRIYEAMGRVGELRPEQIALRELFAAGWQPIACRIGTRRRADSRAACATLRRIDPHISSWSASPPFAMRLRQRTGSGSGIFPRNKESWLECAGKIFPSHPGCVCREACAVRSNRQHKLPSSSHSR